MRYRENLTPLETHFARRSAGYLTQFRAGAITFFFLGRFAIAVPGEVHGQLRAWREYGRLPWKDLVQPAIDLASKGFPISTAVADALSEDMVEKIKEDKGLR